MNKHEQNVSKLTKAVQSNYFDQKLIISYQNMMPHLIITLPISLPHSGYASGHRWSNAESSSILVAVKWRLASIKENTADNCTVALSHEGKPNVIAVPRMLQVLENSSDLRNSRCDLFSSIFPSCNQTVEALICRLLLIDHHKGWIQIQTPASLREVPLK